MSQDYPAQFGRSPLYQNSQGTLPMQPPPAGSMPASQWYTQWMPLQWTLSETVDTDSASPLGVGYVYTCSWTSPAFDLRPDLRSGNAGPKDGTPIWTRSGRLFVQLAGDAQGTGIQPSLVDLLFNFSAQAQDWVNTTFNRSGDRRLGEGIGAGAGLLAEGPVDVSAQFSATGDARTVLVGFAPPGTTLGGGEGYPVRFWRLQLNFSVFVETGAPLPDPATVDPPALMLQASVY